MTPDVIVAYALCFIAVAWLIWGTVANLRVDRPNTEDEARALAAFLAATDPALVLANEERTPVFDSVAGSIDVEWAELNRGGAA